MKTNIELYKQGYTVAEVKAMNNLTEDDVKTFIEKVDGKSIAEHKGAFRDRVINMYDNGYPINVIHKKTSASASIIKKILNLN